MAHRQTLYPSTLTCRTDTDADLPGSPDEDEPPGTAAERRAALRRKSFSFASHTGGDDVGDGIFHRGLKSCPFTRNPPSDEAMEEEEEEESVLQARLRDEQTAACAGLVEQNGVKFQPRPEARPDATIVELRSQVPRVVAVPMVVLRSVVGRGRQDREQVVRGRGGWS